MSNHKYADEQIEWMFDDNHDKKPYLSPEERAAIRACRDARHIHYGIMDLNRSSRDFCESLAEAKIEREGLLDDQEKQRAYDETKQHFIELFGDSILNPIEEQGGKKR